MKNSIIIFFRWLLYVPLSILIWLLANVVCAFIMPYIIAIILWFMGVDFHQELTFFEIENDIFDFKMKIVAYIIIIGGTFATYCLSGVAFGFSSALICPGKNPYISAIPCTAIALILGGIGFNRLWDSSQILISCTNVISYIAMLFCCFMTAYSYKTENS